MTRRWLGAMAVAALLPVAVVSAAEDLPELAFEKYTLPNGLQVILHEDHTAPVVAVNIWYHVGSRNEKPGRTGFAHLFEHMMFQGSAHHDTDYFLPLQRIGAEVNGSTNKDRTNYWENVPADQVELALWLEADRMGWLVPAITQEKLDNQRDVVKNEKRQDGNRPYAKSDEILLGLLYPDEHPYAHTVIGSMADLSAASVADVSEFFELYYTPNNASLCVAGDFDPAAVKAMIEKYFAPVPPGRPVDRTTGWLPSLDAERRAVAEDAVELPRLYLAWHTPGYYAPGDAEFDLLADILATGKNSRLYKALVYEQQVAQDVRAYQESRQLGGVFVIEVTAAPDQDLAAVEAAVDAELDRLLKKGVTKQEVAVARTRYEAEFVRGLQRVGGFGGKADRLNRYNVFAGDPGFLPGDLERYRRADARSVAKHALRHLDLDRRAVLHIVPQGDFVAAEDLTDRSLMPGSSGPLAFTPPAIATATLDNGLRLFLVERHELPLVEVRLDVLSGWSADPVGKPGVAGVTADMLDEGAAGRDALEISARAEALGARLGTGAFFDNSFVTLNILRSRLGEGLELMAEVLLEPDFPAPELERVRRSYLGRLRQEAVSPRVQAIKELQIRAMGAGHPYAQPYTGTGSEASLATLAVADLQAFHDTWYRPGNAAVLVVGDLTLAEAVAAMERAFGGWKPGQVPAVEVPEPEPDLTAKLVVIDRPGAEQSMIVGGYHSLGRAHPDYDAFQTMNQAFGGQFAARINMNLREDKGYTYGTRSQLAAFRDAGFFLVSAPVHTEHTAAALTELMTEMEDLRTVRPLTDTEIADARNRRVMGFPQQFQTFTTTAGSLETLVRNDLPLDTWATFRQRVEDLDAADLARVVAEHLDPGRMVWIVVGDLSAIADGLRALDLGAMEVVGADR